MYRNPILGYVFTKKISEQIGLQGLLQKHLSPVVPAEDVLKYDLLNKNAHQPLELEKDGFAAQLTAHITDEEPRDCDPPVDEDPLDPEFDPS